MATQLVHGKLLKRDRTFHTWKLRHVHMDKDNICCVNHRGARRGELYRPAGILPGGAVDISIRLFEVPKPHGFELRVRDEKLFFAAESEKDRDRWVDALVAHWGASLDQASVNISTDRDRNPALLRFSIDTPPSSTASSSAAQADADPIISPTVLGPLIESSSTIQFPAVLKATGDVLMGVGPFVRRVRWIDEPILAVALYIDSADIGTSFDAFRGRSLPSLYDDPSFYAQLIDAPFRKTFVFSCRKRVSRSGLIAVLHDELRPRVGGAVNELVELTTFVDKSLRKGESMIFTIHPAENVLDFHFKGFSHPSLAAPALCRCIPSLFFDASSIQLQAKKTLVERVPYLWGHLPASPTPPIADAAFYPTHEQDDELDDEEEDDEDEMLEDDDTSDVDVFASTFGPVIDPTSAVVFPGTLPASGGATAILLGTRASTAPLVLPAAPDDDDDQDDDDAACSVGLYVDAAAASTHLVRFKGLSFGSIASDPDFFVAFTTGAFDKYLRLVSTAAVPLASMAALLATLLTNAHCVVEAQTVVDLMKPNGHTLLRPGDAVVLAIHGNGTFHASVESSAALNLTAKEALSVAQQAAVGSAIQSVFYGYHAADTRARARLMQRLPALLDLAKADGHVHTYHDEIVVLKENFNRLTPASRIKVGYLWVYNKQRRKVVLTKWTRRWCRLDGAVLSIFSNKNKVTRRPKEVVMLSQCQVHDLSTHEDMLAELRKLHHIALVLGITLVSGEVLVLRAETVAEGTEWVDALTAASRLPIKQVPSSTPTATTASSSAEASAVHTPTSMALNNPPVQDDEDDDDDDEDDDEKKWTTPPPVVAVAVEDDGMQRYDVGSLMQWLKEDPRNQLLLMLLSLLVWSLAPDPAAELL